MRRTLITFVLVLLLAPCAYAGGGGGMSGGALEMTQLENKAQLIDQLREQVQQTQSLIQQYQNMLQNTLALPEQIWKDATGQLEKLRNMMESAGSLSLGAGFDLEKFILQHPGYADRKNDKGEPEKHPESFKKRVGAWEKFWQGVAKANGLSWEQTRDRAGLIEQLNAAAQSSEGQHQALQAGNQIATYMAQELTNLHSDVIRMIDAQREFAQNEQQERTEEQAAYEKAIGTWKAPSQGKDRRKR